MRLILNKVNRKIGFAVHGVRRRRFHGRESVDSSDGEMIEPRSGDRRKGMSAYIDLNDPIVFVVKYCWPLIEPLIRDRLYHCKSLTLLARRPSILKRGVERA